MKTLKHYKKTAVPELAKLLAGDVSFIVLANIVHEDCNDIFTDGKNLIICYSTPPYPVWVWCNDIENPENIDAIRQCIKAYFPLDKHNIIVSNEIVAKLREIDDYFSDLTEKMELFSYRLDKYIDPCYPIDGKMEVADIKDIEILSVMWKDMALEMEGFELEINECREAVEERMKDGNFYIWRNDEGVIVATTTRGRIEEFGKVSSVYTLPEYRRRGYAINLVSIVTQLILGDGLIPALYTDGGNNASNGCYKKIGYVMVDKLINVYKPV